MFLLSTIISLFSISVKQCRWRIGGMVMSNHGGLFTRCWNLDDKLCKIPLYSDYVIPRGYILLILLINYLYMNHIITSLLIRNNTIFYHLYYEGRNSGYFI